MTDYAELIERLDRESPSLDKIAVEVAEILRLLGKTPAETNEQMGDILREAATAIRTLIAERAAAHAKGWNEAIDAAAGVAETHPMRFAGQTEGVVRAAISAAIRAIAKP